MSEGIRAGNCDCKDKAGDGRRINFYFKLRCCYPITVTLGEVHEIIIFLLPSIFIFVMCVSSNQELGRRKLSARVASVDRTLILTASSNSARPNPSQYPQSGSAAKMAFPHSALDATCFVHDITTQATAGTRHNDTFTNNLEYESRYWEGGCNGNNQGTWPLKDMTAGHHRGYWEVLATPQQTEARDIADARHFGSAYTYDEEDQSTCPTFMSTTSSLASLSSSSSSDELPSRPPSELGWNYEGDRDMGTFGKAPSNSQSWGQPEAVCVDEQDFVETGSGNPVSTKNRPYNISSVQLTPL